MKNPLDVVCPKCNAAITAKCLEIKTFGYSFIDEFHKERIELVNASVENVDKPVLSKSMYP